jgi:hypothetical protein
MGYVCQNKFGTSWDIWGNSSSCWDDCTIARTIQVPCLIHCRYPADRVPTRTSFKSRQRAGHAPPRALQHRNLPPCLGRAPEMPLVPWLRTTPLHLGGFSPAMCPIALDPAPPSRRAPVLPHDPRHRALPLLLGRLRCRHASHGSPLVMGHWS